MKFRTMVYTYINWFILSSTQYCFNVGVTGYQQKSVISLFSNFYDSDTSSTEYSLKHVHYKALDTSWEIPSNIGILPQGHQFSTFKQKHMEEAKMAYDYLIAQQTRESFLELATNLKSILNERLYIFAISVALQHRKDTTGDLNPPLWEVNPQSYFTKVQIEGTIKDFVTGTDLDPEFRLAWWRENMKVNAHHYQWHVVSI